MSRLRVLPGFLSVHVATLETLSRLDQLRGALEWCWYSQRKARYPLSALVEFRWWHRSVWGMERHVFGCSGELGAHRAARFEAGLRVNTSATWDAWKLADECRILVNGAGLAEFYDAIEA